MYLHEISGLLEKAFFLECATLLLMREGDGQKELLTKEEEKREDIIEPYAYNLSELDKNVLQEYAQEMQKNEPNKFISLPSFCEKTIENKYVKYSDNLKFYTDLNTASHCNHDTLSLIFKRTLDKYYDRNADKDGAMAVFSSIIGTMTRLYSKYKNTTDEIIFSNALSHIIKNKRDVIQSFNPRIKKIFISELINIGIKTKGYKDSQYKLLCRISESIGLDAETVKELQEVSVKLYKAEHDLSELIYE